MKPCEHPTLRSLDLPPPIAGALENVLQAVRAWPGELTLYLIGSLTYGAYVAHVSDVDLVAIVNPDNDEMCLQLRRTIRDAFTAAIEVNVRVYNQSEAVNLTTASDPCLAQRLVMLHDHGICLIGTDICDKLPYPSHQTLIHEALQNLDYLLTRDVDWWHKQNLHDLLGWLFVPARMWHMGQTGQYVSKVSAARFLLQRADLPENYQDWLGKAVNWYEQASVESCDLRDVRRATEAGFQWAAAHLRLLL